MLLNIKIKKTFLFFTIKIYKNKKQDVIEQNAKYKNFFYH